MTFEKSINCLAHAKDSSRFGQLALVTLRLLTTAFVSLSVSFLNRNVSAIKYFLSAAVASISVGLGAIYACNFFGVYI